jgi:hypothetical protein
MTTNPSGGVSEGRQAAAAQTERRTLALLRQGVATLFVVAGCNPPDDALPHTASSNGFVPLGSALEWTGQFSLEETDDVINVLIYAAVDPRGGYLVADEREGQVRRYADDGRLLSHFGRRGDGPGEFRAALHASRLPSGEVLVLDMFHRGALLDSTATELVRAFSTPVAPLFGAIGVDSLVLLSGRVADERRGSRETRLHLWNVRTDSLVKSFFSPVIHGAARETAAQMAGFVSADVHDGTVAAVFSLTDTVYLFDMAGEPTGRVAIPAKGFRQLRADSPVPGRDGGIAAGRDWIGSFSLITNVFWLNRDTLLVQYQDRVGPEPQWRLVAMTRAGAALFEAMDTPNLLAVDRRSEEMIFVQPEAEAPNLWARARMAP